MPFAAPIQRAFPLVVALAAAAPARAQEAVQPYTPAPRYDTFHLGAQVTGREERGRDVLFSWGKMSTLGRAGEWMPALELSAGFTTGHRVIEGLVAGPSARMGYALPAQHLGFGRDTRGEPYLVAAASAYGVGRFRGRIRSLQAGEPDGWGIAPAFSAGVGLRMFSDEWEVDLSTLELLVEKRIGFGDGGAQLVVRFGRAVAPRERRGNGNGTPLGPARLLPPPLPPSPAQPR